MQRSRNRLRRVLAVVALASGAVVAFATPAAAHATLRDTSPSNGAKLNAAPKQLTLRFSEGVAATSGSVRLFRSDGRTIVLASPSHPDGARDAIAVDVPKLGDGAYVVTWRVVSEDSHPVQGAFTFTVGNAKAADDASVASLLQQRGGSSVVGAVYGVSRAIAFGAMMLLIGGVAFVLLVWPAGRTHPGVRRLVVGAFVVLTVATVANLLLQGAYASGLGLGKTVDSTVRA